ncbi:MAG TPA: hypothetical protein PK665_05310 [Ignavibacteriaceae bacterium]|nr:hypothetical protein [Ignavibacteriaceae bacterium]
MPRPSGVTFAKLLVVVKRKVSSFDSAQDDKRRKHRMIKGGAQDDKGEAQDNKR